MEPVTMAEYSKLEAGKEPEAPPEFEVLPVEGKEYSCKKRCELGDGKREVFSIRFDPGRGTHRHHQHPLASSRGQGCIQERAPVS